MVRNEWKPEKKIRIEIGALKGFDSYIAPGVVLGVAVGSGRTLVFNLAINSLLNIINKDPE